MQYCFNEKGDPLFCVDSPEVQQGVGGRLYVDSPLEAAYVLLETYYDFDKKEIVYRGAKPPHHQWDWPTKSWLPNLDAAKDAKKAEIEAERNSRISEPLIYDGKVLDADQAARDNLKAKLEEVRERIRLNMPMAPELLVWRDNANVTHSWATIEAYHDWLGGYAVAMSDRGTRCYACAWFHKDAIGQLNVMDDIMNYDLSQGWSV